MALVDDEGDDEGVEDGVGKCKAFMKTFGGGGRAKWNEPLERSVLLGDHR